MSATNVTFSASWFVIIAPAIPVAVPFALVFFAFLAVDPIAVVLVDPVSFPLPVDVPPVVGLASFVQVYHPVVIVDFVSF